MNAASTVVDPRESQLAKSQYEKWKEIAPYSYTLIREYVVDDHANTVDWLTPNLMVSGTFMHEKSLSQGYKNSIYTINWPPTQPQTKIMAWKQNLAADCSRARVATVNGHKLCAFLLSNGSLMIKDFTNGADGPVFKVEPAKVDGGALAWKGDGTIAAGYSNGHVATYKVDIVTWTLKRLHHIDAVKGKAVNALAWKGNELVAALDDNRIMVLGPGMSSRVEFRLPHQTVESLAITTSVVGDTVVTTLITGGSEGSVCVWNYEALVSSRGLSPLNPLTVLTHGYKITGIAISPHNSNVFASCSENGKVAVWDRRRMKGSGNPTNDGALFQHFGNTLAVTDISWHPTEPGLIASTSEDRRCQVWATDEVVTAVKDFDSFYG